MDQLEQQLKRALARKEPQADFTERVHRATARRASRMPHWMATAAALIIVSGGSLAYREHQGRVAKEQVMTAMRITAVKLNHIHARVKEVRP
jgi:hypothetical protein